MIIDASSRLIYEKSNQKEVVNPPGREYLEDCCFSQLIKEINSGQLPLAGKKKYMSIDLASDNDYKLALKTFYELQILGYIPIITNSETNSYLKNNSTVIRQFIDSGALLQVNVSSILGDHGKVIQKYAIKLCKKNLVHFIKSDTHNSIDKIFLLKKAYKYLQKKVSVEYVQFLKENEKHLIKGTDFHVPDLKNRKLK